MLLEWDSSSWHKLCGTWRQGKKFGTTEEDGRRDQQGVSWHDKKGCFVFSQTLVLPESTQITELKATEEIKDMVKGDKR